MMAITDEENMRKIAERFPVPARVADQLRHVVEKTRGGYILYEMRPQWDDVKGPWTKSMIAKMTWNGVVQSWMLYWMPSSMRWLKYGE